MIGLIRDRMDKYLGRGRHSIAVPVMDGPLHPNRGLDNAEALFSLDGVDNLTVEGDAIWCSSGSRLMRATDGAPQQVAEMEAQIACLAADGTGALAVGLDGKGLVIRGGAHDGTRIEKLGGSALTCPTAACFLDADTLAVTVGAVKRQSAEWKRDLMEHGRTGEVWKIDLRSGNASRLADKLAWPYGICKSPKGVAVTEAWGYRVLEIADGAKPQEVLGTLPGYPARIVPHPAGGYVLAIFAPRNQLVEFVLREPEFLTAMTTTVHPDNWIAPKLMWGEGFKEPMQGAALKTMGIIKPWAPTWSYGLVARLDDSFQPVASYHSRADGERHGVTSVAVLGHRILAGAKGADLVVAVAPDGKEAN